MNKYLPRITGVLLLFAATLGWVVSISGLVLFYRAKPKIAESLDSSIDLLARTLDATDNMLAVAGSTLLQAEDDITRIEVTTGDVSVTIGSTSAISEDFADLAGEDIPRLVEDIQTALESMQTSAKLIDDTLGFIAGIPLIGARYKPTVPLEDSVAQVSESLDDIPRVLSRMESNLELTAGSLEAVEADIESLSESIGEIKTSLATAQEVMVEYQSIVDEAQAGLENVKTGLPVWLRWITLGTTAFLIWLIIAQAGLFTQGLELIGRLDEAG